MAELGEGAAVADPGKRDRGRQAAIYTGKARKMQGYRAASRGTRERGRRTDCGGAGRRRSSSGPGGTPSGKASSHLHRESAQDARVKGSIARDEGAREAN